MNPDTSSLTYTGPTSAVNGSSTTLTGTLTTDTPTPDTPLPTKVVTSQSVVRDRHHSPAADHQHPGQGELHNCRCGPAGHQRHGHGELPRDRLRLPDDDSDARRRPDGDRAHVRSPFTPVPGAEDFADQYTVSAHRLRGHEPERAGRHVVSDTSQPRRVSPLPG